MNRPHVLLRFRLLIVGVAHTGLCPEAELVEPVEIGRRGGGEVGVSGFDVVAVGLLMPEPTRMAARGAISRFTSGNIAAA